MATTDLAASEDETDPIHEGHDEQAVELVREGCTMALYVAICLLATLTVASDHHVDDFNVFAVVWGTTLGLAIVHWFAFRMSARLAAGGALRRKDVEVSAAQLGGAASVGALATIPVVLFGDSNELDAVRLVMAAFIACIGFAVARASGGSWLRAALYASGMVIVAVTLALVKNLLLGH
jgi:hypothetical protein